MNVRERVRVIDNPRDLIAAIVRDNLRPNFNVELRLRKGETGLAWTRWYWMLSGAAAADSAAHDELEKSGAVSPGIVWGSEIACSEWLQLLQEKAQEAFQ